LSSKTVSVGCAFGADWQPVTARRAIKNRMVTQEVRFKVFISSSLGKNLIEVDLENGYENWMLPRSFRSIKNV